MRRGWDSPHGCGAIAGPAGAVRADALRSDGRNSEVPADLPCWMTLRGLYVHAATVLLPARHDAVMRNQPVLVFDGDCSFCSTSMRFAERRIKPRCETIPWQSADLEGLGVTSARAEHEVLWVTPTGVVYGGAQAVAKALLSAGGGWAPAGALLMLPPLRWVALVVYRLVADNRHRMPGGTAACALPNRGARGL